MWDPERLTSLWAFTAWYRDSFNFYFAFNYYVMKTYCGVDVQSHVFLTSALGRGEWLASLPNRLTPVERARSTHWVGGWVGPRSDLDDVERKNSLPLPGLELRPLGRTIPTVLLSYRATYIILVACILIFTPLKVETIR
jgi:hypothetical protein